MKSLGQKTPQHNQQREIAVYWDYENVQIPSWISAAEASKALVKALTPFGKTVDRRVYFDFAGEIGKNWSTLDSSGFDLVNTPKRNTKETLDKKLIADVLCFAWDCSLRNDGHDKPCVVVLITSDGDYAYTLNKLRDRGVFSIVIHGNDSSVASILKSSADLSLSFEHDVLKKGTTGMTTSPRSSLVAAIGNDKSPCSVKRPTTSVDVSADALTLCKVVSRECAEDNSTEAGWILGSKIGVPFRNELVGAGKDSKDRYRQARAYAISNGWLLQGRRSLQGVDKGKIVMSPTDGSDKDRTMYSLDEFLRMTFQGKLEIESQKTTTESTALFIKNVPRAAHIRDLVNYLEQGYNCTVVCGNTEKGPPYTAYGFARIQVQESTEGKRLVDLAKESRLKMGNRILQISYDSSTAPYKGDPAFYYERRITSSPSPNPLRSTDDCFILCKVIHDLERKQVQGIQSDWLEAGGVAIQWRKELALTGVSTDSEKHKATRAAASKAKLIEIGKRLKNAPGRAGNVVAVSKTSTTTYNYELYSSELYVRLTDSGREFLETPNNTESPKNGTVSERTNESFLLIQGLSSEVPIQKLVDFLEQTLECPVRAASVDVVDAAESSFNAHVEFVSATDTSKVLKIAGSSDGLILEGNTLVALPTSTAPLESDDPLLFYKSSVYHVSVPSTVSTSSHSMGSSSLSDTISDSELSLFCAITYELTLRYSVNTVNGSSPVPFSRTSWQASGSVAELFQKNIQSCVDTKEWFKKTRGEVITQGLVEMGRRKLDDAEFKIIVVPYFESSPSKMKLSKESYFRLSPTGLRVAKESLGSNQFELMALPPLKTAAVTPNVFLSNLPLETDISDFVEYLQQNEVIVSLAVLDRQHMLAKTMVAHVQFESVEDASVVLELSGRELLIYAGRALRASCDRNVPNWKKCASRLMLFSKDNVDDIMSNDGSNAEEKKQEDCFDSVSKLDTTTSTEDTFQETNLLFGDNFALLFEQGFGTPRASDSPAATVKKNCSSSLQLALNAETSTSSEVDNKTVRTVEIPDLLWD